MKLKLFLLLIAIGYSLINIQAQSNSKFCDKPSNEKDYIRWLERDALYIITQNEREAFLLLKTNDDREHFIEIFWHRRDPTPDTEVNEYKEEYYQRIAYANEYFASGIQGWKTDRGKTYIFYGKPDKIEKGRFKYAGSENVPFEKWSYENVSAIGLTKQFTFVDPMEAQEFRLIKESQKKM
jgi:GWxTD domain-containing protein